MIKCIYHRTCNTQLSKKMGSNAYLNKNVQENCSSFCLNFDPSNIICIDELHVLHIFVVPLRIQESLQCQNVT